MRLTEDMIRVVNAAVGARGRATYKPLVVYVAEHALKDERGRMRRFASKLAARDAAVRFIAEHNQIEAKYQEARARVRESRVGIVQAVLEANNVYSATLAAEVVDRLFGTR